MASRRTKWRRGLFGVLPMHCHYCGEKVSKKLPPEDPRYATLDHKQPIALGGSLYDTGNIVVACRQCNHEKGDTPYDTFVAQSVARARPAVEGGAP